MRFVPAHVGAGYPYVTGQLLQERTELGDGCSYVEGKVCVARVGLLVACLVLLYHHLDGLLSSSDGG